MKSIHQKWSRRKTWIATTLVTGAIVAISPARRALACWFDPIIFDPSAMVEHVEQVAQLGQQIAAVAQQIQNQFKDLAHLSGDVAPNDPATIAGIQQQFEAGLYTATDPTSQLDQRYPTDMSNATWAQYHSDESTWAGDERQSLVENRQIQNQVYQDMDTTRQQVEAIVEASNSAPGETAVIQAHNDLLALTSGEVAKLQALKVARSRLATERLARQQSEAAYAATQQQDVRGDWNNPAPPTQGVVDAFQN
jgi:P-type conjugative transfer protein TrbJ